MYERHFGIAGPPFQLSPDPFFYFDSTPHREAIGAMRKAFTGELPFVVLSGEIGAGKTTVLHTWCAEVESSGIPVGHIANTQLDADELMTAICHAFGIPFGPEPGDERDGDMRSLLRALHERGALLVIDEAQNLDQGALRRLVELAEMAQEEGVPIRICLAGQPELRALLANPTLQDLQARVQHACHLGPLDANQTRQYIEHRLTKVGWTGAPSFDATAFDEIHRLTGGIPRRVNVLGNRLMLSQFLNGTARIDARAVIATAHALHAEIGEEAFIHVPSTAAKRWQRNVPFERGTVLVVASGRSDHIKAVPLLRAMSMRRDFPPVRLVSVWDGGVWRRNRDLHAFIGLGQEPLELVDEAGASLDEIESAFERLIDSGLPGAAVVFDGNETTRRCARAARDFDVPLVHVGADGQSADECDDHPSARAAIARLADLRFNSQPSDDAASAWLRGAFRHDAAFFGGGNILIDAVHLALQFAELTSPRDGPGLSPSECLGGPRGYGVIALKQMPAKSRSPCRNDIVPLLRDLSRDLPLVWPMRRATMLAMRDSGLARSLAGDRIACIEELGHAGFIRLMRDATCVLTDSLDVMEEAAALDIPCLSLGDRHKGQGEEGAWISGLHVGTSVNRATRALWEILFNIADPPTPPALWDGHAAPRIAEHLAHWLAVSLAVRLG